MEEKEKLLNIAKEMHPTWLNEKRWVYVSFILTTDKVIKDNPSNLNMSESLMRDLCTKAKSWLMHEFPNNYA